MMKDALETRLNRRIGEEHQCVPWLVMRAASTICRGRKEEEGFMPHRKWKGREFRRPVAEFGEAVEYPPAGTAGKNKFDVRWHPGVWLGIRIS